MNFFQNLIKTYCLNADGRISLTKVGLQLAAAGTALVALPASFAAVGIVIAIPAAVLVGAKYAIIIGGLLAGTGARNAVDKSSGTVVINTAPDHACDGTSINQSQKQPESAPEKTILERAETVPGTTLNILKLLILALIAGFLTTPAHAGDVFSQPFKYLVSVRPAATYTAAPIPRLELSMTDTAAPAKIAYWEFKPVITVPSLRLQFSDRPGAQLDLTALSAVGAGVSYQRSILVDGKNTSDFAAEAMILMTGPDPQDVSFGIAAGFFNNYLQVGGGYNAGKIANGHRWFAMISTSFTLRQN
jgi:hypothetical protein